jgi:hypothetical protein
MNEKRTFRTVFATAALSISLLVLPSSGYAEDESAPTRAEGKLIKVEGDAGEERLAGSRSPTEVRELMENMMITHLSCDLSLSDDDTLLLAKQIVEYREEMRIHGKERRHLRRELREAVEEVRDDEEIREMTQELLAHEYDIEVARIQALERMCQDCTGWERAKLYLSIVDFESKMRRLMDEARERRKAQRKAEEMGEKGESEGRGGPDGKVISEKDLLLNYLIESKTFDKGDGDS